jgi:type II secretory pathway pseudopilin PulG
VLFKSEKQIIRHQYTIIELLVVLVIAGLLTGVTITGIKGALARQGAAGAVRTLSSKISLARSFAVSRNRYVALLLPDDTGLNGDLNGASKHNDPIETGNTNNFSNDYFFTQTRLCYVNKDTSVSPSVYNFDRWVDGYEWQKLPSKTIAFIVSEADSPEDSNSTPVKEIDGDTNKQSSAIIFNPSGALINASDVIIRVYRAAYIPATSTKNFVWQGKETPGGGWKIGINGFTGRTSFCLGREKIDE